MTFQHQRVGKHPIMGLSSAIGLLMPIILLYAERSHALDVPLDPDGVQRATVEADSYAFTPQHLVVMAGQPVELTFKSVTWVVPHSVIIDDPRSRLHIREEIPSGETRTIKFTPTVPGSFAMYCDKKLPFMKSHREKGQEGVLEVR